MDGRTLTMKFQKGKEHPRQRIVYHRDTGNALQKNHDHCTRISPGTQEQFRKNFYVRSSETPVCPHCGRVLKVVGSRKRTLRDTDGSRNILIIRRLFCEHCLRIHHELPDIIIPYKRHCADTIEEILSDKESRAYPCETSTRARFLRWFSLLRGHWEKVLTALVHRHERDPFLQEEFAALLPLQPSRLAAGWLKRLVRILVNAGFRIQTRSA